MQMVAASVSRVVLKRAFEVSPSGNALADTPGPKSTALSIGAIGFKSIDYDSLKWPGTQIWGPAVLGRY